MANGQPYTSGRWLVRSGEEEEFIRRWTDFTDWSLDSADGAESFALIQNVGDRRRFLSFGAWRDGASVEGWRGSEEFRQRLGRCRELCDEFEAQDYELVSAPQR